MSITYCEDIIIIETKVQLAYNYIYFNLPHTFSKILMTQDIPS